MGVRWNARDVGRGERMAGGVAGEWMSWLSLVSWCQAKDKTEWAVLLRRVYVECVIREDVSHDGVYMVDEWRDIATLL